MQSVSSRIWTRVAVAISSEDNDYTTGTSIINLMKLWIYCLFKRKENEYFVIIMAMLLFLRVLVAEIHITFRNGKILFFHRRSEEQWRKNKTKNNKKTDNGIRTHNPRIKKSMPYSLGHGKQPGRKRATFLPCASF